VTRNIIRIIRRRWMGRRCGTHGKKVNAYGILVLKPEGKRPLRRHSRTRENNIKMELKGLGLGGIDWVHVIQERDQ
jgi:hypothetical protein